MREWFFWLYVLSPFVALVGLIIWDTRDKETWHTKLKEPLTLFTGVLAIATVALVVVAVLQWNTLEKTDVTMRSTLTANRLDQRALVTVSLPRQQRFRMPNAVANATVV